MVQQCFAFLCRFLRSYVSLLKHQSSRLHCKVGVRARVDVLCSIVLNDFCVDNFACADCIATSSLFWVSLIHSNVSSLQRVCTRASLMNSTFFIPEVGVVLAELRGRLCSLLVDTKHMKGKCISTPAEALHPVASHIKHFFSISQLKHLKAMLTRQTFHNFGNTSNISKLW